ncbi:MAG: hypothetical protein ACYC6Z_02745 [Thermoleophilia bacterium]
MNQLHHDCPERTNIFFVRTRGLVMILTFISLFTVQLTTGCAGNQTSSDGSSKVSQSTKEVILTTGASGKEIEWKITDIRRVDHYTQINPTVEVMKADTVELSGEAMVSDFIQSVGLFQKDYSFTFFKLTDKEGHDFQLLTDIATSSQDQGETQEHFTVPFVLADNGKNNDNVTKWGDLIIKDPDPATASLPGHEVSLSVFDNAPN